MKAFSTFVQQDWTLMLTTSVAVQTSMVIAFSWLVSQCVMRQRPAARHACWLGTLCCVLLIPIQTVLIPFTPSIGLFRLSLFMDQSQPAHGLQPGFDAVEEVAAAKGAGEGGLAGFTVGGNKGELDMNGLRETFANRASEDQISSASRWGMIASLIWLSGVAAGILRLFHGVWVVRRLRRDSHPVAGERIEDTLFQVRRMLGRRQLPAIHLSRNVSLPITVGVSRPTVILPGRMLEADREQLRHVLLHECAHIVRGDAWVGVLQRLTRIVYWWQPLVYVLQQQLNRAREELCDNVVLSGSSRQGYAETLVALAASCHRAASYPLAFSLFLPKWRLEDRIANLLDEQRDTATRLSRSLIVVLVLVFGLVGITLAVCARAAMPEQITSRRSRVTFASAEHMNEPVSAQCFSRTASSFLAIMNVPQLVSLRDRLGSRDTSVDEFSNQIVSLVGDYLGHTVAHLDDQFGVSIRQILSVTTGEIGICRWTVDEQRPALALFVEVDQPQKRNQLQADIRQRFSKSTWTRRSQNINGVEVTTYLNHETSREELGCFVYEDFLCLTTHASAARPMLRRLRNRSSDGLSAHPEFIQTGVQTKMPDAPASQLRWYRQPGHDAYPLPGERPRRGTNLSQILDRRLREAIRAAGGWVSFPTEGPRAVRHRSVVLSEALPALFQQGLQFDNLQRSAPKPWVPADVASYASFQCNIPEALPFVASVIDEIVDSRDFTRDVLESIASDPNGPQVDLEQTLIRFLGPRVSIASAIGGDPHRWAIAIELRDTAAVAGTVDRISERDPQARRHDIAGLVVYELVDELGSPDEQLGPPNASTDMPEQHRHSFSRVSAMWVAHGQLFLASRIEDAWRLVAEPPDSGALRDSRAYGELERQLNLISPGASSFQFFAMSGDKLTPPFAFLPHRLAAVTGQEPSLDDLFPPRDLFDKLGETTLSVRTTENGWIVDGCSLCRK